MSSEVLDAALSEARWAWNTSCTYRIVTDHLGSVRLVVDAQTGSIAQAMEYSAFGPVL